MSTWQVTVGVELTEPVDADSVDGLVDALAGHGAAIGAHERTVSVTLTVEAGDSLQAGAAGADTVRAALAAGGLQVRRDVELEVLAADVADIRLEAPVMPELMGAGEVAEMLGVSRQRVHALRRSPGFPPPVTELKLGPLWLASSVRAYAATTVRRSGRPRRPTGTEPSATRAVTARLGAPAADQVGAPGVLRGLGRV